MSKQLTQLSLLVSPLDLIPDQLSREEFKAVRMPPFGPRLYLHTITSQEQYTCGVE